MKERNQSLDFLRFIGVFLTMFRHMEITGKSWPEQWASFIHDGGGVGVDLFFVLSGFLVSGLIFKEFENYGTFNPTRFLIRRGFKIYPAYYLFLAITYGITVYVHHNTPAVNFKYLAEATFLCNYTTATPAHAWLWSICVEEHFYILLCIIMVLLIRFRLLNVRMIITIYFAFLFIAMFFRLYNLRYPDYDFFRDSTRSHLRFDSLFFGVLLSYLSYKKRLVVWKSPLLVLAALAGVIFCFLPQSRFSIAITESTNPLCFGYLMIRMLEINPRWIRPFAYIGKYSYSIYLFHVFIGSLILKVMGGWKYYITYLLASLVVGILISKTLEYPFLALRDKWFPAARPGSKVLS